MEFTVNANRIGPYRTFLFTKDERGLAAPPEEAELRSDGDLIQARPEADAALGDFAVFETALTADPPDGFLFG